MFWSTGVNVSDFLKEKKNRSYFEVFFFYKKMFLVIISIREVNEISSLDIKESVMRKYTLIIQRDHIYLVPYIRPR